MKDKVKDFNLESCLEDITLEERVIILEESLAEAAKYIYSQAKVIATMNQTDIALTKSVSALVKRIQTLEAASFRSQTSFNPKDYN